MSLSRVQYTGTGTTALYSIPFAYISKAYIEVRVGGVLLNENVGFTWQSATSILLTAGNLGTGVVLDIRRATPNVLKLVDFQDGSVLTEADLDLSANQVFQLVQETKDDMTDRLAVQTDGTIDGQSRRIKNVADPVDAQDVVTKSWSQTSASSSAATAIIKAAEASASAVSAAASAVSAASYSAGWQGSPNVFVSTNSFSISPTVPTVAPGDASTKVASTAFVDARVLSSVPVVTGNSGKFLKTDGVSTSWQAIGGSFSSSGYTQNTARLLGRWSASVGAPEEISLSSKLTLAAGVLDVPGLGIAPSMVRVRVANGYGTTNTKVRRFLTVVTNQGSDITYSDSATLGGSFTVNTDGVYALNYGDNFNTPAWAGITLNGANLSADAGTLLTSELLTLGVGNNSTSSQANCTWVGYLPAGSILRAQGGAVTGVNTNGTTFTASRVA